MGGSRAVLRSWDCISPYENAVHGLALTRFNTFLKLLILGRIEQKGRKKKRKNKKNSLFATPLV